jgi:small subunit ribosomal protein S23
MWLMKHKGFSKPKAYDEARREFYKHRHLEEVRRRIAKEEAMHVGAYFGQGPLEIGMELEDHAFESWKKWAAQQIEDEQSMRAQLFSGPVSAEDNAPTEDVDELEEATVPAPTPAMPRI